MNETPEYAADAMTMGEALARFEAEGYGAQFGAREGGGVHCFACREETPACDISLQALIRTEGASDPDDMTAVAALTCPKCETKGTLVLKYGPEAPEGDADVLTRLDDVRRASGTSTHAGGDVADSRD